jgi:hypothetical protein
VVDLDAVLRDPSHPTHHTTAETTCIPIMRAALPRGMPFPLRCSRAIKLMTSCLDSRY